MEWERTRLRVTMTIGAASFMEGDDARSMIRKVDEALYAGKAAGRNRVQRHLDT